MLRVIEVRRDLLEEVLNKLEKDGHKIESVEKDGDYQFVIIYRENKLLNE